MIDLSAASRYTIARVREKAGAGVALVASAPARATSAAGFFDPWRTRCGITRGMTQGVSADVALLCRGCTPRGEGTYTVPRTWPAVLQVCPMPQREENERGFHGLPGSNRDGQQEQHGPLPDPGCTDADQCEPKDAGPKPRHQRDQLAGVTVDRAAEAVPSPSCPPHRVDSSHRHQWQRPIPPPDEAYQCRHRSASSVLSPPDHACTLCLL